MLWHVNGTGLSLLGSIHVLDVSPPPLSEPAWNAFNAARRIIFEHDIAQPPTLPPGARLPPNESLGDVVPASLHAAVQKLCGGLSWNPAVVETFSPWFAAISIVTEALKRRGFLHEKGVDRALIALAQAQGKTIKYLESATDAILGASQAPLSEQQAMLSFAVEDATNVPGLGERLASGWKQRRCDVIAGAVRERVEQMPVMYGSIIEGRNRQWLPRLLETLRNPEPTVAVAGVVHMIGATGLPAMIRAHGHQVVGVDVVGE